MDLDNVFMGGGGASEQSHLYMRRILLRRIYLHVCRFDLVSAQRNTPER